MEYGENLISNDLQVDATIQTHLKETAMWARFLGIVGFVLTAMIALGALFAGTIISAMMRSNPYASTGGDVSTMMGGFITVIYLIMAAIMFFISLFTYKFGSKTKQALLNTDQESLNAGMMNLKFIFRFYGIIMVIYVGIIGLAIIIGILGAAFGR